MGLVYFGQCRVYAEALVLFVCAVGRGKHYADSQNVEHLLKWYVLFLHFAPNGIGAFDACLDGVFHAHSVKFLAYGGGEIGYHIIALDVAFVKFLQYGLVVVGVFVFETEVFKFCLNLVQPETVSNGGEYVERFAGYFVLL